MKSLRYLNTVLSAIAVLLTLNLVTLWSLSPAPALDGASDASAQGLPNAGAQRAQMVEAQNKTNQKLDELIKLLKSGQARVRLEAGAGN